MPCPPRLLVRYCPTDGFARVNPPTGGAVEYDCRDHHGGTGDGSEGLSTDANPVIFRPMRETARVCGWVRPSAVWERLRSGAVRCLPRLLRCLRHGHQDPATFAG